MPSPTKRRPKSTSPDADDAILATLDQVAVLDADALDDAGPVVLGERDGSLVFVDAVARQHGAGAAVPVAAVGLVVDLGHRLAGGAHDPPRIKHHRCDRVVVRVCVEYAACAEVPYLF